MPGAATDYLEQKMGDHIFRSATYTKPTQFHIALFTTMPDDTGANGVEVAGNNYSRIRNDPGDANWSRSTDGTNKYWNAQALEFPLQTGSWGEVIGHGLFDENGNLLIADLLDTPRTVDLTMANPVFPPGYLVYSFS